MVDEEGHYATRSLWRYDAMDGRVPLFRFNVFEPDAASCAQAASCLLDTTQEARVMFEPVFEPVFF